MGLKFKMGDQVRQVVPAPIEGEVLRATIAGDEVQYLVGTASGDQRWFTESEIEAKPGQ